MNSRGIQYEISEAARHFPEKIAIECGKKNVTYRELDLNSNRVALSLGSREVKNQNVIIFMDKGIELIEAILGTLKAGLVFVPIDTNIPNNRIRIIVEESGAEWIITKLEFIDRLEEILGDDKKHKQLLIVDQDTNLSLDEQKTKFKMISVEKSIPDDYRYSDSILNKYCYIYFTSGSTGKPKGVLGRHRSLKHFIDWEIREFGVNQDFKISQLTSPSFDPFLRDVFVPLCAGGTLCIPENREIILEPARLIEWIENSGITLVHMVPSLFRIMAHNITSAHYFKKLKYILLAGELLKGNDIKKFIHDFGKRVQLVNMYGPTETTLAKMFYRIKSEDMDRKIIPVGTPITNTEILILDDNMKKCLVGSVGEVYIRTPYISSGYYNDPDLTRKVFIQNPFSTNPQDIIYKTGDIGRILVDGNLELLGRRDNQVKINGVRIELGEIENSLLAHEMVKEAVVVAKEDENGNKYLCGYITTHGSVNTAELKTHLSNNLPEYMIPPFFIQLESMPLLLNGKVDRKALPEPESVLDRGAGYVAPRNSIEQRLTDIWEFVLGIKNIGIHDDFFALGGNSLKAIQAFSALSAEFQMSINDIFKYKTISELSENIKQKEDSTELLFKRLDKLSQSGYGDKILTHDMKIQYEEYRLLNNKYREIDLTEKNNYANILVTGCTGYLGVHVLYELLRNVEAKIYILVRGNTISEAEQRIKQKLDFYFEENVFDKFKERLFIINGDLKKEALGLDNEVYSRLLKDVECVVNCAADVRHYGHYSDFYEINVNGTRRLIELALEGRNKDFFHISTTGVARGKLDGKDCVLYTENDCDLGQQIESPYNNTKLESEKLVLEARKRGLNGNIIRVGNLVFNSKSGVFQENISDNGLYALIKTFIKLKILPDIQNRSLEFSYIDYVSQAVVLLMNIKNLNCEIYHIYNTNFDCFVRLGKYLAQHGYDLKLVSEGEYMEYLKESYKNDELRPYLDEIFLHSRMLESTNTTNFHMVSDKTSMILSELGFDWLVFDDELAKKMVDYCESIGFFEK